MFSWIRYLPNSFVSHADQSWLDLVEWMTIHLPKTWGITSRSKAITLGRCLLEHDFIQTLSGQNRFEDSTKLYLFMVGVATLCFS
jgi:hypothetical protein